MLDARKYLVNYFSRIIEISYPRRSGRGALRTVRLSRGESAWGRLGNRLHVRSSIAPRACPRSGPLRARIPGLPASGPRVGQDGITPPPVPLPFRRTTPARWPVRMPGTNPLPPPAEARQGEGMAPNLTSAQSCATPCRSISRLFTTEARPRAARTSPRDWPHRGLPPGGNACRPEPGPGLRGTRNHRRIILTLRIGRLETHLLREVADAHPHAHPLLDLEAE